MSGAIQIPSDGEADFWQQQELQRQQLLLQRAHQDQNRPMEEWSAHHNAVFVELPRPPPRLHRRPTSSHRPPPPSWRPTGEMDAPQIEYSDLGDSRHHESDGEVVSSVDGEEGGHQGQWPPGVSMRSISARAQGRGLANPGIGLV